MAKRYEYVIKEISNGWLLVVETPDGETSTTYYETQLKALNALDDEVADRIIDVQARGESADAE